MDSPEMKFVLNGTHKADYYPSHANFCIASYIWTLFEGRAFPAYRLDALAK
jgi:hypothetical protein